MTLIGLRPTLVATARTAVGWLARVASCEYVMVVPRSMVSRARHTSNRNGVPARRILFGAESNIEGLFSASESIALGNRLCSSLYSFSRPKYVVKDAKQSISACHAVSISPNGVGVYAYSTWWMEFLSEVNMVCIVMLRFYRRGPRVRWQSAHRHRGKRRMCASRIYPQSQRSYSTPRRRL